MRKLLLATAFGLYMTAVAQAQSNLPFKVEVVASFDEPWALAFLPDGRMLVTEMKGNLFIVPQQGKEATKVAGVPDVDDDANSCAVADRSSRFPRLGAGRLAPR